ncbi:MAG: radical SAM protein [Chitinophagaceae bacterium]|nr:radical SAM protein [Chitinophagaceae bacterium]
MGLYFAHMTIQSLYQTYNRYKTLQTDKISSLPIVILMPHSACNCRCAMCDIWKGNHNLKQLTEQDISGLMGSLKKFGTRQVLMSGGEALLNPAFFRFCEILKQEEIKITLLSTGLTIKKHAPQLVKWVSDIIVSLDGDEALHDAIRNIPGAFSKLKEGIAAVRAIDPGFPFTARTVIHRLNFRNWPMIIKSAKEICLDQISFLPADVSSTAFNREMLWGEDRQHEILLPQKDLEELDAIIEKIIFDYSWEFNSHFIAESPEKLKKIHGYYAAYYGMNEFPYKKCNAPWVSTVIEADGSVRPCFFHSAYGNIKSTPLDALINNQNAIRFRKNLDMDTNTTCLKCVCSLYLSPSSNIS